MKELPRNILIIDQSEQTGIRIKSVLRDVVAIEWVNLIKIVWENRVTSTTHNPDVIVIDAGAAGPTGYKIIKQVKHQHRQAQLVIFTNYSNNTYKNTCLQLGADQFFDKTTEFEALIDYLRIN